MLWYLFIYLVIKSTCLPRFTKVVVKDIICSDRGWLPCVSCALKKKCRLYSICFNWLSGVSLPRPPQYGVIPSRLEPRHRMLRPEEFVATKTSRRCHGRWVKRPQEVSWLLACPTGNFPQPTNGSVWVAVSSPSWRSITGGDWSSANLRWLVNDPAFGKLLRERLIEMQNNAKQLPFTVPQTFRSLHHLSVESSRGLFRLRICWWKVLPTQLRIRIQYSAVPPNKK